MGQSNMGKTSPIPLFFLCLALFAAIGAWLHWRLLPTLEAQTAQLQEVRTRLDHIENSIELLHFGRDPEGWPVDAVLEYLEIWANREQQYGNSLVEQPVLDMRIKRGLSALRALGSPAYDAVEQVYRDTEKDRSRTPFRKRLLQVLRDLDGKRSRDLLVSELRTHGAPSPIRNKAAQLLRDIDPELAAQQIRQILLTENYRGARHPMGSKAGAALAGYPGFAMLVGEYLRTRDPGKADALVVVLRTSGHDVATYQAAADGLIEMKDPESIETIQSIFENPKTNEQSNALLRRKLARAVVEIQGAVACDWLKQQFARETDGSVRSFLSQLLKQWCG